MINAAKKSVKRKVPKSALLSIFNKAEKDYRQAQEMFDLLGWGELPAELKFVIEADVKGYVDELEGRYSTNCALVQRRRESVDFWVKSYLDQICSLETAINALRVTKL
jgi:hypothetical protein